MRQNSFVASASAVCIGHNCKQCETVQCTGLQDIRSVTSQDCEGPACLAMHVARLPLTVQVSLLLSVSCATRNGFFPGPDWRRLAADLASLGSTRSAQTLTFRHRTPISTGTRSSFMASCHNGLWATRATMMMRLLRSKCPQRRFPSQISFKIKFLPKICFWEMCIRHTCQTSN